MKTIDVLARALGLLVLTCSCLCGPTAGAATTDSGGSVPAVLKKGFDLLKAAGPVQALEAWREGGLLDGDAKATEAAGRFFTRWAKPLGNYQSYEVLTAKEVGKTSKILYLAIRYERGVVFGSFQMYRAERDWVVQQMDFNIKPQVIMPWLDLEAGK